MNFPTPYFAYYFKHKINDIKLFNTKSDTIGYVLHSYDSRSWYQQMGNFFIGVGPIIIGTLIVYLLFILLAPELKSNVFENAWQKNINRYLIPIYFLYFITLYQIYLHTLIIFLSISLKML